MPTASSATMTASSISMSSRFHVWRALSIVYSESIIANGVIMLNQTQEGARPHVSLRCLLFEGHDLHEDRRLSKTHIRSSGAEFIIRGDHGRPAVLTWLGR